MASSSDRVTGVQARHGPAFCLLLVTQPISALPPIAGARRVPLSSASDSGASMQSVVVVEPLALSHATPRSAQADPNPESAAQTEVDLLAQLRCRDRVIAETRHCNTVSDVGCIDSASGRRACTEFVWRRRSSSAGMHDTANDVVADTSANVCRHGTYNSNHNTDADTDDEAEGDALFAALADCGYFRVALTPDEWRIFDAAHAATHAFFAENSAEERKKWVQVCGIPFSLWYWKQCFIACIKNAQALDRECINTHVCFGLDDNSLYCILVFCPLSSHRSPVRTRTRRLGATTMRL